MNTETYGKVVSIRSSRDVIPVDTHDVILERELRGLRLSQEMVDRLTRDVASLAASIDERIRNGALVEPCRERFDRDELRVRLVG